MHKILAAWSFLYIVNYSTAFVHAMNLVQYTVGTVPSGVLLKQSSKSASRFE